MRKLFKKRKGSVLIVLLLIAVLFPAVLILSNLSGDSLKVLVENKNYNQSLMTQESVKLAIKEATSTAMQNVRIQLDRSSTDIDGLIVYGDWYVPNGTEIDLSDIIANLNGKATLQSNFGITNIELSNLQYNKVIATVDKQLEYDGTIDIQADIKYTAGDVQNTLKWKASIVYRVGYDTSSAKGYIFNLRYTNIALD